MIGIKKKLRTSVIIVHAINIQIQSKRDGVRDRLESKVLTHVDVSKFVKFAIYKGCFLLYLHFKFSTRRLIIVIASNKYHH